MCESNQLLHARKVSQERVAIDDGLRMLEMKGDDCAGEKFPSTLRKPKEIRGAGCKEQA